MGLDVDAMADALGNALPPGGPDHPLVPADHLAKVRDCAAWGASGVLADALIVAVETLPRAPDLAALSACLRQHRPRRSPLPGKPPPATAAWICP